MKLRGYKETSSEKSQQLAPRLNHDEESLRGRLGVLVLASSLGWFDKRTINRLERDGTLIGW